MSEYSRRILLAVTGLSPQVVTETLFALHWKNDPAAMPNEVHLITTQEGKERARLALLSDNPGWFHRLQRDYALPRIKFDEQHIHLVQDQHGLALNDIRGPEQNLLCADFITEKVRDFTADPDCALHVSIAGGRKTMGFLLGYAISLFGRSQDRLSHVLVSEPFENCWDFFYPTPHSRVIETPEKRLADTSEAEVTLAEIPFVSLRHGLPDKLLNGTARYTDAVQAARSSVGPATLRIDRATHTVTAGGYSFRLAPTELALLTFFARRAERADAPLRAPPKSAADSQWAERFLAELRQISSSAEQMRATEHALRNGMDGDYFAVLLSRLRRKLRAALGPEKSRPYLIDDGNRRPCLYRLALPPDVIRIE